MASVFPLNQQVSWRVENAGLGPVSSLRLEDAFLPAVTVAGEAGDRRAWPSVVQEAQAS